jgi:hypothetical protein
MVSRPVFVYALIDPVTLRVHYVGASVNPTARLAGHLYTATKDTWPENRVLAGWIRSLLAAGLRPTIRVLAESTDTDAPAAERATIILLRNRGEPLANRRPGGEGIR